MTDALQRIFQIDWRIFMAGVQAWLAGGDPYGWIAPAFGPGAFAYPPTALIWLVPFSFLGPAGFYVWTLLQLLGWWLLVRHKRRTQLILLFWSPILLNLFQGQSTLAVVLVLWAAALAQRRGWAWGLALAWALTKPQITIVPLLWLLWQDRAANARYQFWAGIIIGTLLLALPPTLRNPAIWLDWLAALPAYRERILQMAAWQGPSIVLLGFAGYLWYRSGYGNWHWWISAVAFPHTSFYGLLPLLPVFHIRHSYWVLGGLALAGVLQGPVTPASLPWILAGHALASWMIAGGPAGPPAETPAQRQDVSPQKEAPQA